MQLRAKTERLIFTGLKMKELSLDGWWSRVSVVDSFSAFWHLQWKGEGKSLICLYALLITSGWPGLQPPETRGEASTSGPAATTLAAQYQPKHP